MIVLVSSVMIVTFFLFCYLYYIILVSKCKHNLLGFGVYQIDDLAQTQQVVENGLEVGYRLVDTAQIYGNEQAVGDALVHSSIPILMGLHFTIFVFKPVARWEAVNALKEGFF